MTRRERTWGYSGQVGEWSGDLEVPEERRSPPLAAARYVLERVRPILEPLHRPARIEVSWGEYDEAGEELAFHELEEAETTSWDAVDAHLAQLRGAHGTTAVSCVFVHLDTCVLEAGTETWAERAAELQISFDAPEVQPVSAQLAYRTSIDVWLGATYDEHRQPRANPDAASNAPRLEAMLHRLREVTADFQAGESQTYPFAIVATGFREITVDDLPRRG